MRIAVSQNKKPSVTIPFSTTFGGHPVCCAAGMAAMEYILKNRLMEQVLDGDIDRFIKSFLFTKFD